MAQVDLEALWRDQAQGLFAFLAYRTGDRALAEDLLADAFERALRSRVKFDRRRGSEKTWLYAIALNLLRDHARRTAAEGRALERAPDAPEPDPEGLQVTARTLDGLFGPDAWDVIGWDTTTYVLKATGRLPLDEDDLEMLGPHASRLPLLG